MWPFSLQKKNNGKSKRWFIWKTTSSSIETTQVCIFTREKKKVADLAFSRRRYLSSINFSFFCFIINKKKFVDVVECFIATFCFCVQVQVAAIVVFCSIRPWRLGHSVWIQQIFLPVRFYVKSWLINRALKNCHFLQFQTLLHFCNFSRLRFTKIVSHSLSNGKMAVFRHSAVNFT